MVDKTALKRIEEGEVCFERVAGDFRQFLRRQGYPEQVVWVEPGDVIVSDRNLYIRRSNPHANEERVNRAFDAGLRRGLGVLLAALCVTTDATCCYLWAPRDEDEAMRHLLPRGPKFSVPADRGRKGTVVASPVKWLLLRWKYRKLQKFKNDMLA